MFAAMIRCLGLYVLLGLASGCNSLGDRQRMLLVDGERAFRNRDYSLAAEQLSTFLDQVRTGPEVARAYYVRGMARALAGQRAWAYADLQRAASSAAGTDLVWRPDAMLGVLYFEDENWEAAVRHLGAGATRMPGAAPKDALLYRLGLSYERSGRWSSAAGPYRQIAAQFPQGAYAERARRRLALNADHFAVQCGVFSAAENARQRASELQREGLRAVVRPEERGGWPCYVVLEGRYNSYTEAMAALARVKGYVPDAVLWP